MLKHLKRGVYENETFIEKSDGKIFRHARFKKYPDIHMNDFRILYTSIDTFKQLYNGGIREGVCSSLNSSLDVGENIIPSFLPVVGDCTIQKSGKKSGYMYILQNMDIGLTILLKDWFKTC